MLKQKRLWVLLLTVLASFVLQTKTRVDAWTYPGANGKLAVSVGHFDQQGEALMLINPDGTGDMPVDGPNVFDAFPSSWSGDGTVLIYTITGRIYRTDANATAPVIAYDPFAEASIYAQNLSLTPDGQTIVFAGCQTILGSDCDLYTVGIDGTGLTNLTNSPGVNDNNPDWSADGSKINFTSGGVDLVMDPDGSNQVLSTLPPGAQVSPDGTKILYYDGVDDTYEVANIDGSNPIPISVPIGGVPAFSPDSTKIAYVVGGTFAELGVMNIDGTDLVTYPFTAPDGGIVTLVGVAWQPTAVVTPPPPPTPDGNGNLGGGNELAPTGSNYLSLIFGASILTVISATVLNKNRILPQSSSSSNKKS